MPVADITIATDPFYSDTNLAHLRRGVTALNSGKVVLHDAKTQSIEGYLKDYTNPYLVELVKGAWERAAVKKQIEK